LPDFVKDEFDAFLECGILAYGFLRLRCADCAHEQLVACSCKRRGFYPACGARRMAATAGMRYASSGLLALHHKYPINTSGITLSTASSPAFISTGESPGLSQNCTYTSPWAATMYNVSST
jgi:ribosomal protein S27E